LTQRGNCVVNNFEVKRFAKIVGLRVFCRDFCVRMRAMPPQSTPATRPQFQIRQIQLRRRKPEPAEEEVLPSQAAPALFYIGPSPDKACLRFLPVVAEAIRFPFQFDVCTWIVAAIILSSCA
jgi:hypothetical protein